MGKIQGFHHLARLKERVFPLFLGLFFGFLLGGGLGPATFVSLPFFLYFAYKEIKKGRKIALFFLLPSLGGFLIRVLLDHLPYPDAFLGYGIVREARDNYFIFQSGARRYLVYLKDSPYETGDILRIEGVAGKVLSAHYEGRFDFGDYLEDKGVYRELEASSIGASFLLPLRLRALERSFLSSFDEPTKGLLDSFLFGVTDYANESLISIRKLGLLAVFGVSGVYLSLFKRLFERLYSLLPKKKRFQPLFVFLSILPFGLFGLRKAGIRRALGLSIWEAVGSLFGKEKPPYLVMNPVMGLLEFLIDPYTVIGEGFLLSYGLSFFFFLYRGRLRKGGGIRRHLAPRALVFAFFLPLYTTFSSFSLLAPIAGTIFVPLLLPFMALGRLAFVFPSLKVPLAHFGAFMAQAASSLSDLPLSIPVYGPLVDAPYLHYGLLFLASLFDIKGIAHMKRGILTVRLLTILISYVPRFGGIAYEVSFIDVGQGDAILLRVGSHALLVDTGGNRSFDMAEEALIPYFRKIGLRKLDALAITHDDYDHMGAEASLLSSFKVQEVLNESSFPYTFMGATIESLNSLSPKENDKNLGSLVLSFSFGDTSFLLMGDATEETENDLMDRGVLPDTDILKVAHHGSKSSSSVSFLEAVSPSEAVISCGEGNSYGHPDKEVLSRFESLGITVRRTDLEGTIVYRGLL